MLLSRTFYSLTREMYLAGCELHIQTFTLLVLTLKQYVNAKTIWGSKWRLLPASHDLRGLDSAHSWSFFGEEVCFRTESAFYPWSAVFSLHFYPQSAFYPWSAVCVLHWPYLKLLDGNSTIDYISSVFFGFTLVFGHIIVLKRHESKRVSSPTLEKQFYRVNGNNYE